MRELLPDAMRRAGVDAWVVIARENDNDPLAAHVGGENAGGTAAFLFLAGPGDALRSLALSPRGEAVALGEVALHDSVIALDLGESVWERAAAELRRADPRRIAVNVSSRAAADGLSHTQRLQLEEALGPELRERLVSSEDLVVEWLSVKLPEEVEILRRAAELTARMEVEAYAHVVPGETTDGDVARLLKRRMEELGVEDAWAPAQNPNVNSGPDRGHAHATERVIQPGDVIQTDFGIRVYGVWVTDIQRFAYVLRPGESQPPPEIARAWESARDGGRTAFRAMRPGLRGYDVDAAQRRHMRERGSLPVPWSTGHPVGYWAHDVGPSLGGAQREGPPAGDAVRLLRPGQVFAFDGFHSWPWDGEPADATKTISVEEMVVVTDEGAEYLVPPQEELILIR
ncbi:MAG: M24 family metallopeptidase [Gemmatimonadota bacterium]